MVLKITRLQSKEVNKMVRKLCCNCVFPNCLLLDDGEETKCVQLISKYGIYCNYFRNAVLPANKDLFAGVLKQNENLELEKENEKLQGNKNYRH